jgi:hypothetical protein
MVESSVDIEPMGYLFMLFFLFFDCRKLLKNLVRVILTIPVPLNLPTPIMNSLPKETKTTSEIAKNKVQRKINEIFGGIEKYELEKIHRIPLFF